MSRRIASHKNPYGSGLVKKGKYLQYRINVADWELSGLKRLLIPVSEEFASSYYYNWAWSPWASIHHNCGNPWRSSRWSDESTFKLAHTHLQTSNFKVCPTNYYRKYEYNYIFFPMNSIWEWSHDIENHKYSFTFYLLHKQEENNPSVVADDDQSSFWTVSGSSTGTTISDDTSEVRKGANSLKIENDGSSYIVLEHGYSEDQDWSDYDFLCLWWYGYGTGTRFRIVIFTDRSDNTVWRAYHWIDDFVGWRRLVFPLRKWNEKGAGGEGSLSTVCQIDIDNWNSTMVSGTWYLDRMVLDIGRWVKIEHWCPDKLNLTGTDASSPTINGYFGLYSWTGSSWSYPFLRYDTDGDLNSDNGRLYFLNGITQQKIMGSETVYHPDGITGYLQGIAGETMTEVGKTDGNAGSITYSSYKGVRNRFGFALKMPPYDFQWYTALEFNGEDDYVEVPYSSSIDIDGDLTIEAIINAYDGGGTALRDIVTRATSSAWYGANYRFVVNDANGKLELIWGDGTNSDYLDSGSVVENAGWKHVVARIKGDVVSLFIDGEKVNEKNTTVAHTGGGTAVLCIGTVASLQNAENNFKGKVAIIRIYNRALSESEIQQNYNNLFDGYVANGLVFEFNPYKQETGETSTVYDQSGNGNHGTIYGASWCVGSEVGKTISACKLKLEVHYDDSKDPSGYYGQATYEFEDSTEIHYGLQNMSDPYIVALVTPSEDDHYLVLYIDNKQHLTGLMVCADENENIHWIEFSVADGTEWYVFEEWGNTQELDENNWSKFYKSWLKVAKK